jgi:D-serine deaminase-like pyridoxal phosphate-dependent protein
MGLDLVLRQTYYLTWLEPDAVQPETARVDAKVAPARVLRAQVEELARRMSVTVEVDTEGGSAPVRARARTAGAVQEIVQASGELGVVGDLGSELGAHVSAGRHEPSSFRCPTRLDAAGG